jgi:hypothetical protein
MRYHGTDEDSANDIVQNGLNRKKWQTIVAREGGDPSGFSLTDDPEIAREHARKAATLRGRRGAIISADDADLPAQATGNATQAFDPDETKILPQDMKQVGPGVFKLVEKDIPPFSVPPTPP